MAWHFFQENGTHLCVQRRPAPTYKRRPCPYLLVPPLFSGLVRESVEQAPPLALGCCRANITAACPRFQASPSLRLLHSLRRTILSNRDPILPPVSIVHFQRLLLHSLLNHVAVTRKIHQMFATRSLSYSSSSPFSATNHRDDEIHPQGPPP